MINILFIGSFPEEKLKNKSFQVLQATIPEAVELNASFVTKLAQADALVSRSGCKFSVPLLRQAPKLKLLIKAGAGIDMIDKEYCKSKNITIKNTPGENAQSVTELTVGLMIDLARNIIEVHDGIKNDKWLKDNPTGIEISNKNVTIFGYGYIGRRTAQILKTFGCNIMIHDLTMLPQERDFATLSGFVIEDCPNCAVKKADFIILHPSYNPTSDKLINRKRISKMKQGVRIINVSRGDVVDEQAVLEGLKSGVIGGLAIDTWWKEPPEENPFKDLKNVIMTPHIGANTREALGRTTEASISTIKEFFNLNDEKDHE